VVVLDTIGPWGITCLEELIYDADPFTPSALAWWREEEAILCGPPNHYNFGEGLNTRGANGVYFIEVRSRVDGDRLIRIANLPNTGRTASIQQRGPQIMRVESDLVVPLVRGRDVQAFNVEPSGYIILPHDPEDRSKALDRRIFTKYYPHAWAFFRTFRDELERRSPYLSFHLNAACWWQVYETDHMTRGFLVCVAEIASLPRCRVLEPIWDDNLGRTVLPAVDRKVIFYSTSI